MIEIRLLGELEIRRGGVPVTLPASKRTRALLGYLAAVGRPQRRGHLCDLLWEQTDDPKASLRWSLTKIRPLVDDAETRRLVADREHAGIDSAGVKVDVRTVRDAVAAGVETLPVEDLRQAAERFRGELLEGLDLPDCHRFEAWLLSERDACRSLRLSLLAAWVKRLEDRPDEALAIARTRVSLDPLSEPAHVDVVRLLGRLGRNRDAIAQYDECRRLLETELRQRPSRALEDARRQIGHAPETPRTSSPIVVSVVPEAPLVGREPEQDVLHDVLRRAGTGESWVLVVLGEPGIGKSRLLGELRRIAAAGGCALLSARAFETETVRPYGPWIDALRGAPPPVPERLRSDLALLLPELGRSSSETTDRARLFEAVVERLADLGRPAQPVIVVLDDCHWLDPASAALLHYAARVLGDRPVLFAVGARPGELADNPAALKLVRALPREARVRELTLAPLDETSIARLAAAVAPGADAARVFAESRGHPLFAVAVARALAEGRDPSAESLGGLIDETLARLEPAARELIPWAAAMGRAFDLQTLARITETSDAEILASVRSLERRGVLGVRDGHGYDFVHDLVRDGAYRLVSAPARRLLHGRIARHLAGQADEDGVLAPEIARHALLAGDHDRAIDACLRAGERCRRLFAYGEAAAFAERGLAVLDHLPAERRLRAHVGLLSFFVHSGMSERTAHRVEREMGPLIDEVRAAGLLDLAQKALDVRAFVHWWRGDHARAHEETLRAVESVGQADPVVAARALATTGRCLVHLDRDLSRAREMLAEAAALGRVTGTEAMDVPWGLGLLDAHAGRSDDAVPRLERVRDLARRAGDRYAEWDSQARLAMLELERDRPRDALSYVAALDGVVALMSEGSEPAFTAALAALARRDLGEPGADAAVDASLAALRSLDSRWMLSYVASFAASRELEAGALERAARLAAEALEAASAVGRRNEAALARSVLARVAWRLGDRTAAEDHRRQLLPEPIPDGALSARALRAVSEVAQLFGGPIPTMVPTVPTTPGR